jgi:hypothetical protein
MANPVYLSKNLVAASSTGIGTISSASPAVTTLNTSQLDTQRRISIFSASASLASFSFTITGTRQGPGIVTETITGPTSNVAVTTTQDFLSVTSILASCAPIATPAIFGTNTVGGTPWQSVNLHVTPIQIGCGMHFTSTANSMIGQIDITMDNPFLPAPSQSVGGVPYPLNSPPVVFVSTAFSSANGADNWDAINIVGGGGGTMVPIVAWRLTLTSSSSGAGTVFVSAAQAGIG